MFGIDEQKVIAYGEPSDNTWTTKAQFAALVEKQGWSKADVTAIWNANVGSFKGEKPVKMFRNRPYGIDRIWDAIQVLKSAEPTNGTPKKAKPTNGKPREGSKREKAIELLKREGGVGGEELQKLFGWQAHTVRGFISTLGSKYGMAIEGEKHETKGTVYRAV